MLAEERKVSLWYRRLFYLNEKQFSEILSSLSARWEDWGFWGAEEAPQPTFLNACISSSDFAERIVEVAETHCVSSLEVAAL